MPPLNERGLSIGPMQVLFDILRARAGRGDQAEGRGLANTTVLFRKVMLNPGCDSRLFTCIHGWPICAGSFLYKTKGFFLHLRTARITKALALDATEKALFYAANVGNSVC